MGDCFIRSLLGECQTYYTNKFRCDKRFAEYNPHRATVLTFLARLDDVVDCSDPVARVNMLENIMRMISGPDGETAVVEYMHASAFPDNHDFVRLAIETTLRYLSEVLLLTHDGKFRSSGIKYIGYVQMVRRFAEVFKFQCWFDAADIWASNISLQ